MNISRKKLRLYAVTDSRLLKNGLTLPQAVEQAIRGGATVVQLREKNKSDYELISLAKELMTVCRKYDVPLIINDSVEVAFKSGADGVHLGLSDGDLSEARRILGERAIIGATAHNLHEAKNAWKLGADYLGCGAVFQTATKNDTVPLAIDELKAICSTVDIPVVAIGGIKADNIMNLKNTGVSGAAIVSAIFACDDICNGTALLKKSIDKIIRNVEEK